MSSTPLTPETYARIDAHLDATLDRPAHERAAYIDTLSLPDDLKALLHELLAHSQGAHPLDAEPHALAQSLHESSGSEEPGAIIGGYRLLELIGEGGMATVWRAQREDGGVARVVALKCLKTGFGTPQLRERFLREQRILARLEHRNIARLYDAGVAANGVPFIAMELVDGLPITRHADARQLDTRARLKLFRHVIEAVAYAHAKLVVHRDLKPANILVAADGLPRLLDFGIAKPLDEGDTTTQTQFRALTPDYAAPEQFSGPGAGTATDVYGLGATLYELLARRRPRRARRDVIALAGQESSLAVACSAPSVAALDPGENAEETKASSLTAAQRQRLHVQLRGELDTLVQTAMHPEPARRYRSATELDDDIARYLDGLPLRAQPDSLAYRVRKFVQRHALGLAVTAVVVVTLFAVTTIAINRAVAARTQAARAAAVQDFLFGVFEAAQTDARGNGVLTTREMVDNAAARLDRNLLEGNDLAPELKLAVGRVYRKLGLVERAIDLLRRAVDAQRRESGPSRALATAQQSYGMALADGLHFAESEQQLRAALAYYERSGADAVTRAGVLDALFSPVYYQTHYDEAARIAEQTLQLLASAPSASLSARIAAHLNHAVALRGLARFDEAIAAAQGAVALARTQPDHQSDQARALSTLGSLQRRSGDCAAAVRSLREAVALDIDNDRQGRASRLHNLARALICTGDFSNARGAASDALAAQILALGPNHPELGQYREALGLTMQGLRDYEGAEQEMRAALSAFRRGYPPGSVNVRRKQQMLAQVLVLRGNLDEAQALFDASLAAPASELAPEIEARCIGEIGLTRIALARADGDGARRHLALALAAADRHALLESDTQAELERTRVAVAALP